jgi:BNR repeat-like domain
MKFLSALLFAFFCIVFSGSIVSAKTPIQIGAVEEIGVGDVLSMDVYQEGNTVHVLTAERGASEKDPHLVYRRFDNSLSKWSVPVDIQVHSKPHRPHRGADVQIASNGETLIAAWTKSGPGWGGYGAIATAVSNDGGATWRDGTGLSDDAAPVSHSFIDLSSDGEKFHAVWLDSRDGAQGLRYANSADGVEWARNTTLAPKTCDCCSNTLLSRPKSPVYVLYRAASPRDMSLFSSNDAGASWNNDGSVAAFGWNIEVCPDTGGALSAGPDGRIAALSWTGKEDRTGLYYVSSLSKGKQWNAPMRIGDDSARHGDIAYDAAGGIGIAWDQTEARRSRIRFAYLAQKDVSAPDAGLTLSATAVDASYPRIVAQSAKRFLVLWTEKNSSGTHRVKFAHVAAE